MKKLLLTVALSVACAGAFAQGKVTFGNDSLHLLVFGGNNLVSASGADFSAFANQAIPQLGAANQQMQLFTAQLWAGTSSSSLTLATSVAAGQAGFADGRLANVPVTLTGIPASTPAFFQVRFFETAGQNYASAASGGYLAGQSPIFQVTPGSITPNPIVSTTFGTWAPGAITVAAVPEPSTFALMGLGAAALMIFRRRQ